MHPNFSTRLRAVTASPDAEYVRSRWAAVEWLTGTKTHTRILELASVAFGLGWPDDATREQFVSCVQEDEPNFDPHATREHSVLAASALERLMEANSLAVFAALATSCASVNGLRDPEEVAFLGAVAEHRLETLSANRLAAAKGSRRANVSADAWTEITDLSKQNNNPDAFAKVVEACKTLQTACNSAHAAIRILTERQKLFEEEVDILWWITGGQLRKSGERFRETEAAPLAIGCAVDLADLTRVAPGPMAIADFVLSTVSQAQDHTGRKRTLKACVDAVDKEQREYIANRFEHAELSVCVPVTVAFKESVRSSSWKEAFEHETKLSLNDCKFRLLDLGVQLYRESLLIDAYRAEQNE